jgi:hypothetical protein
MHPDVRVPAAGKCPHCGMSLVPEGSRLALIRHVLGGASHIAVVAAIMAAIMAAAMMVMR